jgi:hypothetical protein
MSIHKVKQCQLAIRDIQCDAKVIAHWLFLIIQVKGIVYVCF